MGDTAQLSNALLLQATGSINVSAVKDIPLGSMSPASGISHIKREHSGGVQGHSQSLETNEVQILFTNIYISSFNKDNYKLRRHNDSHLAS